MSRNLVAVLLIISAITFEISGQGFLVSYPQEPQAMLSSTYSVFVNEIPVTTYAVGDNQDVSYVHFAFAGKVTIRIHVSAPVNTFDLSPHSYGIETTMAGQDISFELTQPRKLLLHKVNRLAESLCILADPPEDNIPRVNNSSVVDVTSLGIDNTGATDNLEQIKSALKNLPDGGILFFPPGRYTAGGIIPMVSNRSIYIAGGAVIQGSTASSGGELSLNFDGASHVKIFGRGSLDGNGDLKRGSYHGEGGACLIYNSNTFYIT